MRYELIVQINGTYSYLDTYNPEDLGTSLNYNISDIADITTKNNSYSKTIKLPDTKNNRISFEYISELSSQSTFDPTKKSRCWVLKDTVAQFEGNFQLTGLEYDRTLNVDSYYITIYQDSATLIDNIGEKYLADLNLERFDLSWNFRSIDNSWYSDYTNGVYFPLIDYGNAIDQNRLIYGGLGGLSEYGVGFFDAPYGFGLNMRYFLPSVYVKPIFDQMILEAGSYYYSDFLNSDFFKNLLLPFNNKVLQSFFFPNGTSSATSSIIFKGESSHNVTASQVGSPNGLIYNSFEVDTILFDPNNLYDTVNYNYTNNLTEGISQNFTIHLNITTINIWHSPSDDILIGLVRSKDPITGEDVLNFDNTPDENNLSPAPFYPNAGAYPYGGINSWPMIPFNGQRFYSVRTGQSNGQIEVKTNLLNPLFDAVTGTFSSDYLTTWPLRPGEKVKFFFMRVGYGVDVFNGVTILSSSNINDSAGTNISTNINYLVPVTNSTLHMEDILPQNVKQKDFLTSLIKMFNLYIEPVKGQINAFNIEPRDDYYNKYQTIKDWSRKLDISIPYNSDITSNGQKRRNIFTYKEDKDLYNEDYTKTTNQIYGQYQWDIDNENIVDETKIEVIFSPTPIDRLPGSENIYLPIIEKMNNGNIASTEGMNIRLLYKNVQQLLGNDKFYVNNDDNGQGVTYSFYPYAGPFDNPIGASVSLNFGQVESYYFPFTDAIDNVFYTYWQNTMSELSGKDSRIVTAYFNLTSNDISQFRFSDLILCKFDGADIYFRVNKIFDYDPSKNQSTKVELIQAIDYIIPRRRMLIPQSQSNTNTPLHNHIIYGNISQAPTNEHLQSSGGMGNVLNGQYNVVNGGNNILISGNNNSNNGNNGGIFGNNNNVGG